MEYTFVAQDELDIIDMVNGNNGKAIKDRITINITIEMDKTQYEASKKHYRKSLAEKVLDVFQKS